MLQVPDKMELCSERVMCLGAFKLTHTKLQESYFVAVYLLMILI